MLKFVFTVVFGCLISMGLQAQKLAMAGSRKPSTASKQTVKKPAKKVAVASRRPVTKKATAKKTASKKVTVAKTTRRVSKKSTELALDAFSMNKGKFMWPVEDSHIKTGFGLFKVAETNIVCSNPGLTLEAAPGAEVKSIYDGVVTDLFQIEGKWGVTVQHGAYRSVYSNLSSLNIAKDDRIASGDIIGTAANNSNGNAEVEFLLLKNSKNIDPEPWMVRK